MIAADLVSTHANVLTMDPAMPHAQPIAVGGGRWLQRRDPLFTVIGERMNDAQQCAGAGGHANLVGGTVVGAYPIST
jgi:hypothetical protein